eukprot:g3176.t1
MRGVVSAKMSALFRSRFPAHEHVSPNAFHRVVVTRPCLIVAGSITIALVLSAALVASQPKLALSANVWYDTSHILTKQQLAFQERLRTKDDKALLGADSGETVQEPQSVRLDTLSLVYRFTGDANAGAPTGTGALLGKAQLEAMAAAEAELSNVRDIYKWCKVGGGPLGAPAAGQDAEVGHCDDWAGVVTQGSLLAAVGGAPVALPDTDRTRTVETDPMWCGPRPPGAPRALIPERYLGRGFKCGTGANPVYARSQYAFGGPIRAARGGKPYKSVEDRFTTQVQKLGSFVQFDVMPAIMRARKKCAAANIELMFGSGNLAGGVTYGMMFYYLFEDMGLAAGAMVFVFLWLWANTGSCFLACVGFFEIVFSVPVAFAIWTMVGMEYISFLQFMGLFILLGIGADDIFILNDAMRQARVKFPSSGSAACGGGAGAGVEHSKGCCSLQTGAQSCASLAAKAWRGPGAAQAGGALENEAQAHAAGAQLTRTESFFNGPYFEWISRERTRKALLVMFAVVVVVAAGVAGAELKISGNFPEQFKPSHPYSRFGEALTTRFAAGSSGDVKRTVSLFWGIDREDPVDRSGLDFQADEAGVPKEDADFDLSTYHSQRRVLDLYRNILLEGVQKKLIATDFVEGTANASQAAAPPAAVHVGQGDCFMEEFVRWLGANGTTHSEATAPLLLSRDFLLHLRNHTRAREARGIGYLSDVHVRGAGGSSPRAFFAYCTYNSTIPLKFQTKSLSQHKDTIVEWETLLAKHNGGDDSKVVRALLFCRVWFFVIAGEAILSSTITGVSVCIVLAFSVLLLTTRNYLLAALATVLIVSVLIVVAFLMVLMGFEVDFIVSIALIVVVGLSVDYTVHFVHVYNHSAEPTRAGKARDCLVVMGVSVVCGAATTFFAAFCLSQASLTFFNNFGIFMVITVVLSLIFSLVLLIAALVQFGPQATGAEAAGDEHTISGDLHLRCGSAVRGFGITMCIMIVVDYFFVITLYAAAVVLNERTIAPALELE